jgi:hypothetical protein
MSPNKTIMINTNLIGMAVTFFFGGGGCCLFGVAPYIDPHMVSDGNGIPWLQ